MSTALLVVVGYLLGSMPWGYWLVRLVEHEDYEHAYFLDYRTDRASYIDAFFDNLDWSTVNDWVAKYQISAK